MAQAKRKKTIEFGDFQTPPQLALEVCDTLKACGIDANSILEPTCGVGTFLVAASQKFPGARTLMGLEINSDYAAQAHNALAKSPAWSKSEIIQSDFFRQDWKGLLAKLPDPLLIIGNPPWVTNAQLSTLGSRNLPKKSNFQDHRGIDAITGKGNFDISEWMLLKCSEWLHGRCGTLAMLCKTSVARKVLLSAWKNSLSVEKAEVFPIDALAHFGVSVDSCLLVICFSPKGHSLDCRLHSSLSDSTATTFGYRDGDLVADVKKYDQWRHLQGGQLFKWRSGVKHDCSRVMELMRVNGKFENGLGELVQLEDEYLYPMLKSSHLAAIEIPDTKLWMLVTQQVIGENTRHIEDGAPLTWRYLQTHSEALDRRSSSIYKNRARFSVFGVGDYTFSEWKVGISGFYKALRFHAISPRHGKPVVFDDTCYFVPCRSRSEAMLLESLLNSEQAYEFYSAFVFWDSKRPITVDLLKKLDIFALSEELGFGQELKKHLGT